MSAPDRLSRGVLYLAMIVGSACVYTACGSDSETTEQGRPDGGGGSGGKGGTGGETNDASDDAPTSNVKTS